LVAAGSAAPLRPPADVIPGLDARWVAPGVDTMVITEPATTTAAAFRRDARKTGDGPLRVVVGTTIQRVRRVRGVRGEHLLEVQFEQRDDTAALVTRATTWVDATTLLPRRQRADLDAGRVVTLEYDGGRVTTIDSAPGRGPRVAAAVVPDSAYSAGAIDLVLRALPLAAGYRTSVPLYFPSERLVYPVAVRVTGEDRITTRAGRPADCWRVAALFPGAITEQFWIEERSHALLRILAHDGATSLARYDR
jgi:hypothetical protein